jgi:hypothetical protein
MHSNIIKIKKLYTGILAALLSLPIILSGSQNDEFDYEFIQDGNRYSFRGSFVVTADRNCLIDVIYNFEHISKYATDAESVELVQQGQNWYEVTYTYRKFLILENKSTWRRTLKRDEQKVIFEMISSENNVSLMPQLLSSSGYYQIKLEKEGYQVEYFQECKLKTGILKDAYINQAKKVAIKFLREFKQYIERTCD